MDLINFRKDCVNRIDGPGIGVIDKVLVNIQMRITENIHANCSNILIDHLNRFGDFPRDILEYSYNTVKEFCVNNP